MKKRLLAAFILCSALQAIAGDVKFSVKDIPADLKENVNAVVREDVMVFKIWSKSKATLFVHFAVTILNGNAKHYATQTIGYDKLRKITSFKANVYDEAGNLIKKLKNNEIQDQSAYDGFSLFSDNRLKRADLSQQTYPYTVEYEYEIEYKYLYSIDGTYLLSGEKVSTQHVSYQLIYPPALTPRYKAICIDQRPKKENMADGFESLSWSFENLKPIKLEPAGPRPSEALPHIIAAPSRFEYEGYAGSMDSWDEYGRWISSLNKGRNNLPEETKQKLKDLTNGLTTTEEKTSVLYKYLQSKTRYVSIQLGIGGLQPFDASVVDANGYGDCKALSNYMVAMLDNIGVKAYYATVMAGEDAPTTILDFPSHQSNHVIVAVPNVKDTLWLECTSQSNPFGYMGTFTGDRKALLITEDGGKIVNTPHYPTEWNVQSRKAEVHIEISGNARATVQTNYAGLRYEEDNLNFVLNNQFDAQRKWIQKNTQIPSFDIGNFTFSNDNKRVPSASVQVDLTLKRFASVSGKRLFVTPNLMNRSTVIHEKLSERKTDVLSYRGYIDVDTIRYLLPENLYPEFLPEPIRINSKFGEYEANFKLDQGSILYTRKIKMFKGRFSPETYNEMADFYRSINKADNMKLVFLNKT